MSLTCKIEPVGDVVKHEDAMQKYMKTDKGKAARKKASQTYRKVHGNAHRNRGDANDIMIQLEKYFSPHIWINSQDISDDQVLERTKLNPFMFQGGTDMWKAYVNDGFPSMTRKRYLSLLPSTWEVSDHYIHAGRKVFTPVYKVNLLDFFGLE